MAPRAQPKPYLVVTIFVFRTETDGYEAICRIADHELTRVEGAELSDVLVALMRGVAHKL